MDKLIKITLSILGALVMFLLGWVGHAWKNRKEVTKEVKKAIVDVNAEHKKALRALKSSYEEKLKKKDEIITSLNNIINRLLTILAPMSNKEIKPVNNLVNNLNKNQKRLSNL